MVLPSRQNYQKHSLKEKVFANSALKIQYHVVKNTPADCFFGDFTHWVLSVPIV